MMRVSKNLFLFSTSATIQLPKFDLYKLDYAGNKLPTTAITNREECLSYYREMEIMRKMEIACDILYKNREIRGFCHLYDGQEAIPEGMEAALTFEDPLIGAYRVHCQAYKRGFSVREIVAEMLGKETGATRGKGGSMHYYNKKTNWYGGNGIVGAQIPVGAGLAFALKYQKKRNVAVCMFGDGAANQGQIFEAANMAYLWKLPCIFLCENNKYGMGTSIERSSMNTNFHQRGDVIPGLNVDGNNVFAVRESMKWAKQYAVEHGPLFMQYVTYRYHGHSMSDPGISYRTRDEVQERRKTTDPLTYLRRVCLDNKFATEEELNNIEAEAKAFVNKEVELARSDPIVGNHELLDHVYVDNQNHFKRGIMVEDSYMPKGQKY